jgi:hypothetical protein
MLMGILAADERVKNAFRPLSFRQVKEQGKDCADCQADKNTQHKTYTCVFPNDLFGCFHSV